MDKNLDKLKQSIAASLDKGFQVGGLVELVEIPRTYFQIVGGSSPFWNLKHFGGPLLPDNYYKTYFNCDQPEDPKTVIEMVIETILLQPNAMEVIAVMADEEDAED